MGLSDVGLNYVSKNADEFIRNADNATNAVTKLNSGLLRINANNTFGKSVGLLSGGTQRLDRVTGNVNKTLTESNVIIGTLKKNLSLTAESTNKMTEATKPLPKYIVQSVKVLQQFNSVVVKDKTQRDNYNAWILQLAKAFAKIPAPVVAAGVAIAGFKVASFVIEKFGERAAGLTGIADSFERLRQSAGLTTTFLSDFAKEADNQLSQGESLVLLNKALAGSQGEFQKELANSLPTLLEFARVRSAATGEDVNFLFESLIQGIKKQQPEILDNLGLVFRLDDVYNQYAASLGITRNQLTAVQKQQAVLNATNAEALRNIEILGEASLSNADKIKARENIYADIADNISLAFQPLLGVFLDIEIFFARLIGETLAPFINIAKSFFTIISTLITEVFNQIKPVFQFFGELIQAIVAPFEALGQVLAKIAPLIIGKFLEPYFRILLVIKAVMFVFEPLIPLLELIAYLWQTVGDVISGLIDFMSYLINVVGGAITNAIMPLNESMGFLGITFESVKETIRQTGIVLAYGFGAVFATLVNVIAGASRDILRAVADLAQGIADFLIGESPPPKGPLSRIDEGGKNTFEAWLDGFTSLSLSPVEEMAKNVDMSLADIGKLSLPQVETRLMSLDKSLQPFSEQLQIVQSRFEAISKPAEAALKAIDRQLDSAIEALTKGDASAKASVQALDAQRAAIYKNLELQQQQVDFAQIQLALKQAQQSEERTLLEIQKKRLSGQQLSNQELKKEQQILQKQPSSGGQEKPKAGGGSGGNIPVSGGGGATFQESPTGSQMGDFALQGFVDTIDLSIYEDIGNEQERIGTQGGRIAEGLTGLPDRIGNAFGSVFGPEGSIAGFFDGLFGEEGTVTVFLNDTFAAGGTVDQVLNNATLAWDTFKNFIGGIVGNIVGFFTGSGEEGQITLGGMLNSFFGEGGTLSTLLSSGQTLFTDLFDSVFGSEGVLSGVGDALNTLIETPMLAMLTGLQNIINSFIGLAEQFLNDIINSVEGLVEYIPTELRGSLGDIIGYELVLPRVQFVPPQAAKGGIFSSGLMSVGEKGQEYIAPANKIGVFPNNFVTAIQSLESVLVRAMAIPSGNNISNVNSNTTNNSNQVININQPMNPSTLRQQLSLMGG